MPGQEDRTAHQTVNTLNINFHFTIIDGEANSQRIHTQQPDSILYFHIIADQGQGMTEDRNSMNIHQPVNHPQVLLLWMDQQPIPRSNEQLEHHAKLKQGMT
jgi:hypothetical protein